MAGLLDRRETDGGGLLAQTYDPRQNLDAAHKALKLTPQERALYERHLTNLWGTGGVTNPDGSRSTLYQMTMLGPDCRAYNIQNIWDRKIHEAEDAVQRAKQQRLKNIQSYT